MWYALQLVITFGTAYIWLTEISDQKDVGHAICLGAILAFYATVILSGILNTVSRLIRATASLLLGRPRQLRTLGAHKESNKLVLRRNSTGHARPPRLIS